MANAPMIIVPIAWDSFTGIAQFRTDNLKVDCVVSHGIIRRTIPSLKRFTGKPLRTAFDWYNRHPDLHYTFTHRDVIDPIGPSPWRYTPGTR
jgi:hypothetical protein